MADTAQSQTDSCSTVLNSLVAQGDDAPSYNKSGDKQVGMHSPRGNLEGNSVRGTYGYHGMPVVDSLTTMRAVELGRRGPPGRPT